MSPVTSTTRACASTGIPGLDDIMAGGFTRRRLFLVEGVPGSGKTTLALQYLMAAARGGEPVLYVTLSETEEELRAGAESHGWALDGIEIRELTPPEEELDLDEQNTMFHPSEVELASITKLILDDVERLKPTCVVFDSLSELRLLAGSAAPLPAADSRAEAVLRDQAVHRAAARRPDRDRSRSAGAEHRARRRAARAAESRVRIASVAGSGSSSTAACSFAAAITTT